MFLSVLSSVFAICWPYSGADDLFIAITSCGNVLLIVNQSSVILTPSIFNDIHIASLILEIAVFMESPVNKGYALEGIVA